MFWKTVGACAALLTMFSFVPQIVKSLKSRSVKDISLVTLVQMSLGVSLWMIYGIYLKDVIIIVANMVTLLTTLFLLNLYFAYGRRK